MFTYSNLFFIKSIFSNPTTTFESPVENYGINPFTTYDNKIRNGCIVQKMFKATLRMISRTVFWKNSAAVLMPFFEPKPEADSKEMGSINEGIILFFFA